MSRGGFYDVMKKICFVGLRRFGSVGIGVS
jgi:hypothetical protein